MPPQPEQNKNEKRRLPNGDTIERVRLEDFGGGALAKTPEQKIAALERTVANLLRAASRVNGSLHFVSQSSDPTLASEGDVAVVGGKLKVYTSGAWVVVGTQS